jgi:hypothetical protein
MEDFKFITIMKPMLEVRFLINFMNKATLKLLTFFAL